MATVFIEVVYGSGSLVAKRNGTIVATITPRTGGSYVTYSLNDKFEFTATPDAGFIFNKFCGDQACNTTTTANPFSGTITKDTGYLGVYFDFSSPPPTTPPPTLCNPSTQFNIAGVCVDKQYAIFGAVGFFILMMLSGRSR